MKPGVISPAASVTVLGSLNLDIIATVESLPRSGQTVPAHAVIRRFGGKGANQAIASARQGAATRLIGCLGDEAEGKEYREYLLAQGVGMEGVVTVQRQRTGTALIAVNAAGENVIMVAPGANSQMTERRVRAHRALIAGAGALLLQWEVPLPAMLAAIAIANRAGVPVLFNPSPLRGDFPWGDVTVDLLIVNEGEAQELFGRDLAKRGRAFWKERLQRHGLGQIVITRGARSTWAISPDGFVEVPTLPVKAVDTVGAGDAFAGALAAQMAEGAGLVQAVAVGNCAGAMATLKAGAQEAIPSRRATDAALRRLRA